MASPQVQSKLEALDHVISQTGATLLSKIEANSDSILSLSNGLQKSASDLQTVASELRTSNHALSDQLNARANQIEAKADANATSIAQLQSADQALLESIAKTGKTLGEIIDHTRADVAAQFTDLSSRDGALDAALKQTKAELGGALSESHSALSKQLGDVQTSMLATKSALEDKQTSLDAADEVLAKAIDTSKAEVLQQLSVAARGFDEVTKVITKDLDDVKQTHNEKVAALDAADNVLARAIDTVKLDLTGRTSVVEKQLAELRDGATKLATDLDASRTSAARAFEGVGAQISSTAEHLHDEIAALKLEAANNSARTDAIIKGLENRLAAETLTITTKADKIAEDATTRLASAQAENAQRFEQVGKALSALSEADKTLDKAIKATDQKVESARAELDAADHAILDKAAALQTSIDLTNGALSAFRTDAMKSLDGVKSGINGQIAGLQKDLSSISQAAKSSAEALHARDQELQQASSAAAAERSSIRTELQDGLEKLETRINQQQDDFAGSKAQIGQQLSSVGAALTTLSDADKSINALLEATQEEASMRSGALELKIDGAVADMAALKSADESHEESITALTKDFKDLSAKFFSAEENFSAKDESLEIAIASNADKLKAISTTVQSSASATASALETMRSEFAGLKGEATAMDSIADRLEDLEANSKTTNDLATAAMKTASTSDARISSQLLATTKAVADLAARIQALEIKIQEAQEAPVHASASTTVEETEEDDALQMSELLEQRFGQVLTAEECDLDFVEVDVDLDFEM
eukprot:tig00021464_g21761.t1